MKSLPPKPDFFKPLLPGFKNGLKIPKYFSKYILGTAENFSDEALLKKKGKEWRVSVRNGYFVGDAWARFAEENNLESGDFIVFNHHGNMVFDVEIYDGITQCNEKHHTNGARTPLEKSRFEASTSKTVDEEIPSDDGEEEEVPDNSTDRPHFMATISHSNTVWCYFSLPKAFAESNDLTGRKGEIIVKDEQERSWYFGWSTRADDQIRIKSGRSKLAEFFTANGFKKGDSYKFEVVAAGNREEMPVVRILSDQSFCWSYYVSTIKPYSLGRHRCLNIPMKFAESNGLCEKHRMILENKSRRTWEVNLSFSDSRLRIAGGWKKFVDENGIKVGDAFKFEIVENGAVPVVRFIVVDV